jgi:Ulp1 family protease
MDIQPSVRRNVTRRLSAQHTDSRLATERNERLLAAERRRSAQTRGSTRLRTDPAEKPETGMRQVTRRETRSQTANAKTEAYVEYAAPHAKRKITLFRDDLAKLDEGEFLNDTIIEFYLMYPPNHFGG